MITEVTFVPTTIITQAVAGLNVEIEQELEIPDPTIEQGRAALNLDEEDS
jgi:hypothetical protein